MLVHIHIVGWCTVHTTSNSYKSNDLNAVSLITNLISPFKKLLGKKEGGKIYIPNKVVTDGS